MKYLFAAFTIILSFFSAYAQEHLSGSKFIPPKIPESLLNQLATFRQETDKISYPIPYPPTASLTEKESDLRGFTSVQIGTTYFDLQTNASVYHSLFRDDVSGKMYAVWNFAPTIDPDFTTRGTGYNYFNGNLWLPDPTARLESARTGWPNILVTAGSPQEYILCHNLQFNLLQINKRTPPGAGVWSEELGNLQSPNIYGMWWPRIARGDTALHYLHAVALTLPKLNGGLKYNGMDGCLLYYRSSDNGASWDKQKILIDGLDSTLYARIRPDNYAIDAYQNTVDIVIGGYGNDITLFHSPDQGLSWTKTTVQKFPIPHFYDQITDIDGDSIADLVNTNDGSLAVLIDNSGTRHVFAGYSQIYNDDSTDNQFGFLPTANGILYWNSNFLPTEPMKMITGALDLNENGILDVSSYGFFNTGFATHPSAGIDAAGNVFLSYSAVNEIGKDADGKNVRHTYLIGTSNSGIDWSYPYDVVSDTNAEGIYACMARVSDNNLHLIYQKDFCAGIGITYNDPDPCNNGELNSILYIEVSAEEVLNHTGLADMHSSNNNLVYPNPSAGEIHFTLPINYSTEGVITVYDVNGKSVYQTHRALSPEEKLDLRFLPTGWYVMYVETAQQNFILKISIGK